VGRAVVLSDVRMVDRDVGGPLLEVLDRVAPIAHDPGHELVGLAGGAGGIIHEPALCRLPGLLVAGPDGGLKFDDLEFSPPLLTVGELRFGRTPIAGS
jgi:hypothetical protein